MRYARCAAGEGQEETVEPPRNPQDSRSVPVHRLQMIEESAYFQAEKDGFLK